MAGITAAHQKEKAKRDWKFREEKTVLERYLSDSNRHHEIANYFLAAIFMVLLGIFMLEVISRMP